jgi:hypothetical protein
VRVLVWGLWATAPVYRGLCATSPKRALLARVSHAPQAPSAPYLSATSSGRPRAITPTAPMFHRCWPSGSNAPLVHGAWPGGAARAGQAPVKRGERFSAKAATPSAKSPEAAISRWIPASNSSWASIRSYSQRFSWRLVPA